MELRKESISFDKARDVLLLFDVFDKCRIRLKIKDDHAISLIGNDIDGDGHTIEIKTKYKIEESFGIYYVNEGKKLKGKIEMSDDPKCIESLRIDSLLNVMVDQTSLYLYGAGLIDGRYAKYSPFLTLAEVETISVIE